MAVNLSPVGGVAAQFFDNNGVPLSGGFLYTYAAGTSTPQTTYTSSSGITAQANPIVLDSSGRVPSGEIWLTDGLQYKFVLQNANAVLIGTYDNIIGINSNFVNFTNAQEIQTATASQTVFTLTTMQYQPSTGSLSVFVDGVNQYGPGAQYAYTETSATVVTFVNGLHVGASVKFTTSAINASSYGNSSQISYTPAGTGAVVTNVQAKLRQYVSVMDFGADNTGATDSSTSISQAIATGKAVYFPSGTYACNITINNRTILFGDGSTVSQIKPFSNSNPAMIYAFTAMTTPSPTSYWNYHSEIRNLGFYGTSASDGQIGFSFGTKGPGTYTANAEFAGNVQFYNCFFYKLTKGVQFPFGNIGTAFYSCGFQSCYYGVYMLNNKSGSGSGMHAGNKYFYNGEFSLNVCAVYLDNAQSGFGGVSFTDTIFENNYIVGYFYNSTIDDSLPIQFKDCWNEGNGIVGGFTGTVAIDLWTGNVVTTQNVSTNYPWIINNNQTIFDGGYVYGINLTSDQSRVYVTNSITETVVGYGGTPCAVTYPNSRIYFEKCASYSGFGGIPQAICYGVNYNKQPNATTTSLASGRLNYLPLSYGVQTTGAALAGSGVSVTFLTAQAYTGATSGTATQVSDGIKYATCNQFTYNFTATSQYIYPTASVITTAVGWYVYTFDVKVTAGTPKFLIGDLNINQLASISVPADSKWHTVGGVAYVSNVASINLETGGVVSNCTWYISAYQIKYFQTESDAQEFLASRTYLA